MMILSNDRKKMITLRREEARWPSGRASDTGARGRWFDPHSGRRVVSLSKIHLPPKSPRKQWLRPNMTEKLFIRTLSKNESITEAALLQFSPYRRYK